MKALKNKGNISITVEKLKERKYYVFINMYISVFKDEKLALFLLY